MNSIFKTVPAAQVPHSKFDLSHNRKLSCGIGQLVPVLCQEAIPSDYWKISSECFARFAPMIAPIMHKVEIFIHGFFVPMRVLYERASDDTSGAKSWEKFISGDNVAPETITVPYSRFPDSVVAGSLADHLGLPIGSWSSDDVLAERLNMMPFMTYMMIWNDYYRDENLEAAFDFSVAENIDGLLEADLKMRAWEKDYFSSAWPWGQKGVVSAAVIEIEDDAAARFFNVDDSAVVDEALKTRVTTGALYGATSGKDKYLDTDLTIDILELRRANKMQIWMERTARAGSRLTEFLKGHFGVWPKDERLQRAEYIGGGRFPFVISDVTNTTGFTDGETNALPMGTMAGKGVAYGNSAIMSKKVDEHGYIMVIMSIRPEAVYFQGLPRMFSKLTYLDFPFPEFADMGEQEILNKEIFLKDANGVNDVTFGYQSRYAEYKFIPNTLHGAFRTTLDFWSMARKFADTPDLNADFVHIDETADDLTRVFAVDSGEHVYMQVQHRIECDRPLPFFNIPSLE